MVLDIQFQEYRDIRVSIHGDNNIKKYCHTNSISDIKDSLEFIEKKRFKIGNKDTKPLDFRNYNTRINLKEETNLKPKK